jgi:hypothetical protein
MTRRVYDNGAGAYGDHRRIRTKQSKSVIQDGTRPSRPGSAVVPDIPTTMNRATHNDPHVDVHRELEFPNRLL